MRDISRIKPYKVASHKIWEMKPEKWNDVLKLDWNEATIPPSPMVDSEIKKLLETRNFYNIYPETNNTQLIKLLADYVDLPVDNIQYFASSDSLHEYISRIFIEAGNVVTILWPSYDNFRLTAEMCGGKIDYYRYGTGFRLDEQGFIRHLESTNPCLVYICNPNNPTGTLIEIDFIEGLLRKFPNIMFIIDEAYSEFAGVSSKKLVLKYNNIIISRTMSKAFALANFRFGYALSSVENIKLLTMIRNPKNVSTFAQVAVCAALCDLTYMENYVADVNRGKEYLNNALSAHDEFECYMGYGNYLLVRIKGVVGGSARLVNVLEKNNIFVRVLDQDPILKDCIRITVGNVSQMQRIMEVIEEYIC